MSEKTAYCIECGGSQPYSISTTRETGMVRGIQISYLEDRARCRVCGGLVYVPEVNDENVKAMEESFRKAAKLITIREIQEILEKYNIGAGPLAKVLGFGGVTVNRYLSGQLPSKAHSDLLLKIRASHRTMEEYLEAGRGEITEVAYQKCREAVDRYKKLYGDDRIKLVARYIIWRVRDITAPALQKLLYYSQAFYQALFHETLFPDDCQAWARGPVYQEIYYWFKELEWDPNEGNDEELGAGLDEMTTRERSLLDAVIESFGEYSGTVLSEITHRELPWLEARGSLLPEDRSVTVIDRGTIDRYFQTVVKQYQIINPCDIRKYCEAMKKQVKQ